MTQRPQSSGGIPANIPQPYHSAVQDLVDRPIQTFGGLQLALQQCSLVSMHANSLSEHDPTIAVGFGCITTLNSLGANFRLTPEHAPARTLSQFAEQARVLACAVRSRNDAPQGSTATRPAVLESLSRTGRLRRLACRDPKELEDKVWDVVYEYGDMVKKPLLLVTWDGEAEIEIMSRHFPAVADIFD